jgi:hypothetical protein
MQCEVKRTSSDGSAGAGLVSNPIKAELQSMNAS